MGGGYEFDKTMLSFDSAKLLLFSYSYSMLNETEKLWRLPYNKFLTLALNNNNNIYNYENYIKISKGMTKY